MALWLLALVDGGAQEYRNFRMHTGDGKTVVSVDVVLDSLRVPSNRYRAYTPIIISKDGREQRLKSLLVTGRRQEIVFDREGIDPLYAANCATIRRHNDTAQSYAYSDVADGEPWHVGAEVWMEQDLCGCGDRAKTERVLLGSLPPDPYELIHLQDVVPQHVKKERSLHGTAYITFVVDKWEVKPDYMSNRRELRKITDTLDVMVADPNVSVRQVKIHGYASPESPYDHNAMLAANRARSLTDYVRSLYDLPAGVFARAESTPENWAGLRKAVSEMSLETLPHRQEILALIDDPQLKPDPKEWKIKKSYPADYRYLLQTVYPGLRRSDYEISFNFSDFTLEQAREIYRTKPYQLSVRELWDVAQTMAPGSEEYNKVLQQTVIVYPDDPAANLNLAYAAIRARDLLKASTLLERAGDSGEALQSRAVVAMLQKRYADAGRLLDEAAEKGIDVSRNREALQKLRN